jgi:hypothetical protein
VVSDEPDRGVSQREGRGQNVSGQFGPDSSQPVLTGLPTLVAGALLGGRFRLGAVVGHVGVAKRWIGTDENLGRSVFITTFANAEATTAVEAAVQQAATKLDDRVLEVFDTGHESDIAYIVTQWVDGRTLTEVLRQGPLAPEIAASVVRDVASILANVHAAGVCHGRLTPASVCLTTSGSVRVGGLCVDQALTARLDDNRLTPINQVAMDVAACGGLLYACLTGMWPGGGNVGLPAAPRDSSGLRPPAAVRPGAAPVLDQLTRQILSQNDPQRLSTAKAVATALSSWLGQTDVSAALGTRVRCTPSFVDDEPPRPTGVRRPRIVHAQAVTGPPSPATVVAQSSTQPGRDPSNIDQLTTAIIPARPDGSDAGAASGAAMMTEPAGGAPFGDDGQETTSLGVASGIGGTPVLGSTAIPGGPAGGTAAFGGPTALGMTAALGETGAHGGATTLGGATVFGGMVGLGEATVRGETTVPTTTGAATDEEVARPRPVPANPPGAAWADGSDAPVSGRMSQTALTDGPGAGDGDRSFSGPSTDDGPTTPALDSSDEPGAPAGPTRHLKAPMTAKRARAWSRMTVILAVVIVVALITGVVIGMYNSASNRPAAPVTSTPTPTLTPRPISAATVIDAEADGGSGLENDDQASLACDGDPATAWMTEEYVEPIIPERKPGVGLIFDLGAATSVSQATITVQQTPITVSLYIPKDPTAAATADPDASTIANWTAVVSADLTQPATTVDFSAVTSRYVAIYITKVVDLGEGRSQADLAEVSFAG